MKYNLHVRATVEKKCIVYDLKHKIDLIITWTSLWESNSNISKLTVLNLGPCETGTVPLKLLLWY